MRFARRLRCQWGQRLELVDVGKSGLTDVTAILTRNISHKKVVLGVRDESRREALLQGLSGRVSRNGVEEASSKDPAGRVNDDMIENVRAMADTLSAFLARPCARDR